MIDIATITIASAIVPLIWAFWLNRRSTIVHALVWAGFAWAGWLTHALVPGTLTAFAALSLTGGAGIAVFGARRPGVIAWHFVVATLVIVQWIGWAEGLVTGGELKLGLARLGFLTALLSLNVVNYLPTRAGLGAMAMAVGCYGVIDVLWRNGDVWPRWPISVVAGTPWLTWLAIGTAARSPSPTSRRWQQFRDRFGVVWSQRLREQFQAATKHNGWQVELHWDGLHGEVDKHSAEIEAALAALEKRFVR